MCGWLGVFAVGLAVRSAAGPSETVALTGSDGFVAALRLASRAEARSVCVPRNPAGFAGHSYTFSLLRNSVQC